MVRVINKSLEKVKDRGFDWLHSQMENSHKFWYKVAEISSRDVMEP
jgi:hypothetical protein